MGKIYDAVVVGSGPAATAFLCSVSDELKIAVISKKNSRKVCGGLLSSSAIRELNNMGLSVPEDVRVSPEVQVIRTMDLSDGRTCYYPRDYVNVDREKFDSWLLSLSEGKYDFFEGTCIGFEKFGENYCVKFLDSYGEKSLVCRSIIGGDGANSVIRRNISAEKNRKDMYTAIQQWYDAYECKGHDGKNAFSCIFDGSVSDSYAWTFTKDDKIAFGGAYPKQHSRERFESEKKNLEKYGITFGKPISTEACTVVFGKNTQKFLFGVKGERVYLTGEAAGLISPSSLEGISSALKSGYELGKLFIPERSVLPEYTKKLCMLRLKLRLKRFKSFVLCSPFLRFLVMKSGITAKKIDK